MYPHEKRLKQTRWPRFAMSDSLMSSVITRAAILEPLVLMGTYPNQRPR